MASKVEEEAKKDKEEASLLTVGTDFAELELARKSTSKVVVLSSEQCRSLYPMSAALDSLRQAFLSHYRAESKTPPRLIMDCGEGSDTLFMPCLSKSTLALKVVSVRPGLPISGFMTLLDGDTGRVLSLMDSAFITGRRTAAGSGVIADLCANPDSKVCTVFGAGVQGTEHMRAMIAVRPSLTKLFLVNLIVDAAKRVADATQAALEKSGFAGREVTVIDAQDEDAIKAAVEQSDIVCTCTPSGAPVFKGEWLKPGVHMNCIGAYRAEMREIDAVALHSCERVVLDSRAAMKCGDLCSDDVALDEEKVTTAGELLSSIVLEEDELKAQAQLAKLRAGNTLYDSVGFATMDLFAAKTIYEQALDAKIGTFVDM